MTYIEWNKLLAPKTIMMFVLLFNQMKVTEALMLGNNMNRVAKKSMINMQKHQPQIMKMSMTTITQEPQQFAVGRTITSNPYNKRPSTINSNSFSYHSANPAPLSQLYNRKNTILFAWEAEPAPSQKSVPGNNGQQRNFSQAPTGKSEWKVPNSIEIPEGELDISFVRSSGAGGQNVNKLSTKAELRLDIMNAHWIPYEVRQRINVKHKNRINKNGIFSLQVQESRTQIQNKKIAIAKLGEIILGCYPRPKIRKIRTKPSKASKERKLQDKKKHSEKKKGRKRVDYRL